MAHGALDQSGKGSAAERSSRPASASCCTPEAVWRLSREFDLSERQAYRYLKEASQLDRPVEVPETTVPVTLKLPPRTAELLRKYARSSGLTMGAIVSGALNAFAPRAASRSAVASPIRLLAPVMTTTLSLIPDELPPDEFFISVFPLYYSATVGTTRAVLEVGAAVPRR